MNIFPPFEIFLDKKQFCSKHLLFCLQPIEARWMTLVFLIIALSPLTLT